MGSLQDELVDEWVDSAAALRRFANNSIRDMAERQRRDASAVYEFLCECGDLRCQGLVELSLADYDRRPPGAVLAHAS